MQSIQVKRTATQNLSALFFDDHEVTHVFGKLSDAAREKRSFAGIWFDDGVNLTGVRQSCGSRLQDRVTRVIRFVASVHVGANGLLLTNNGAKGTRRETPISWAPGS